MIRVPVETPPHKCANCDNLVYPRYSSRSWWLAKNCSRACANRGRHWSGKGWLSPNGYRMFSEGKGKRNWNYEHRRVMETMIDRKLLPNETVHHKNGIRHDNRPENLELWQKPHGAGQRTSDLKTREPIRDVSNGILSFGT